MAEAIKVLVSDKLAKEGVEILQKEPGVEVTVKTGMKPEELKVELPKYDAIIIRSETKQTADILAVAPNIKAIARAGTGIDNVDVPAASKNGAIVMNTPGGNTISTAELAVTLLLSLCRHIAPACAKLKAGEWDKKSFQGVELNGKTMAVVGLGRIGCEVAKRCKAFGMRVIGYDPFISSERAAANGIEKVFSSVPDMVKEADFITVHTPLDDKTRGIIGKREFDLMKPGVRLINDARGGIIDEEALLEALNSGKVAGAALDVFTKEPPTDRRLIEHPKVLCTPHLGASTEEAQITVAVDAATQIIDALKHGEVRFAVNYPALSGRDAAELAPYGRLALKLGTLAGQIAQGQMESVEIVYAGEIAGRDLRGVTMQCTMGLMRCFEEGVNPVSAPLLAKDRGIDIRITTTPSAKDFQSSIEVRVRTSDSSHVVAGAIFGKDTPRIVDVDGYHVEIIPEGSVLIVHNQDKPGLIGGIGKILGDAGVNIAAMTFGRKAAGGDAIAALNVDAESLPARTLEAIATMSNVNSVRVVKL